MKACPEGDAELRDDGLPDDLEDEDEDERSF